MKRKRKQPSSYPISQEDRKRLQETQRELKEQGLTLRPLPPPPGRQLIYNLEFEVVPLKH